VATAPSWSARIVSNWLSRIVLSVMDESQPGQSGNVKK
jgi:hypothetical protein